MNVADRRITAQAPFDTEKLDLLMQEAGLDAVVGTGRLRARRRFGYWGEQIGKSARSER